MHGRLALAGLCATLLVLTAAPVSAASDAFDAAKPLFLGTQDATVTNVGATVEPGESLTPAGLPGLTHCDNGETSSQAQATMWWWVTGTGRPLTITTAGSELDTHLGIFEDALNGPALCQDADEAGERVTLDSVAGRAYRIQVGGCLSSTFGCGAATGRIRLLATSPAPPNDRRAAAAALPTGQPVAGDNYAAGEEPGEQLACGGRPYGRTVWYRWTAPGPGTARFAVSAPGAAVAAFTGDGDPLGCDAAPGGDARLALGVGRGEHLLQVSGIGAHAGLSGDSSQAPFTVQAAFTPGADGAGDDGRGTGGDMPRITSRARLSVRLFPRYAKVLSLSARRVPAGARVQLRCSGRSCRFRRTRARTVRRASKAVSLMTAKLRAARIVPTTTLEVRVTRADRIGRVMRFRFTRAGRDPVLQTRCLPPGASIPRRC
jgi:hypothetical protein